MCLSYKEPSYALLSNFLSSKSSTMVKNFKSTRTRVYKNDRKKFGQINSNERKKRGDEIKIMKDSEIWRRKEFNESNHS